MNSSHVRSVALLILVGIGLLAPAATNAAIARAAAKPVVVLQGVEVTSMDPAQFTNTPQQNVLLHVFDMLTAHDPATGKIVPRLAESWEVVNPTTWRFVLRKGVTFQNGEPFNAQAVKYTLDRLTDPAVKAQQWFFVADAGYASSTVIDDYTIEIVTKTPSVVVADALQHVAILPPKYYGSTPLETLATKPIGAGPYRLTEWVKDDHATLQRWDGYWGQKPAIETIIFKPVPELSTRISQLITGAADLIDQVAPDQTGRIDTSACCTTKGVSSFRDIFIMIDLSYAPFSDVRVRQAMNYAVNKQALLDAFFKGNGKILAGVANGQWENTTLKPYAYDPAKAKQLLADAGFTPGPDGIMQKGGQPIKVIMNTPSGRYTKDKDVAQAVASDLVKAGIAVDVQPLEWSVLTQKQQAGTLAPLTLLGLGGFFNGVGEMRWIDPTYKYSPRDGEIRWQNQQFVDLYAQEKQETDPAKRKVIVDQMQQIALEGAPWIFLYKQFNYLGVNKNLAGWSPRPDEVIDLRGAQVTGN